MIYLELLSPRTLVFYHPADPAPAAVAGILFDRLRDPGRFEAGVNWLEQDGPSSNATITLDNGDGELVAELTIPPRRGRLWRDGALLLEGAVTRISLGEQVTVSLATGGTEAALIRPLALRTTADWGAYLDLAPIPLVFGRVTTSPIPYSRDRRDWCVSDGAIQSVESATVAGKRLSSGQWAWRIQADPAGRPVTLVEFQTPPGESDTVAVEAVGLVHPIRGTPMENPADIAWYLLAHVAGVGLSESALARFRAECARDGLTVGGVIDEPVTLRQALRQVLGSVGALWSESAPGLARLWPGDLANDPIYREFAGEPTPWGLVPLWAGDYSDEAIQTAVQVEFDWDWSVGGAQQSVRLEVDTQTLDRYGRRSPLTLSAPWLHSLRAAEALGARVLQHLARPGWTLSITTGPGAYQDLPPAGCVGITDPASPLSGRQLVHHVSTALASGESQVEIQGRVGRVPTVTVVQRSSRATTPGEEAFQYRDGDTLLIVARSDAGDRLPGATVNLSGRQVLADREGVARFPGVSAGIYDLQITLGDYSFRDRQFEVI